MLAFYLSIIDTEEGKIKFSKIYENYLDWMLKVAYHFTKNTHDAEEIVHDVFVDFAEYNSSVPTNNSDETKSYLFICIRNKTMQFSKHADKLPTVSFDSFFTISSEKSIEDHITNEEFCAEVERFINTMKPIYKDALTLHYFYNKSIKEIAQILNVPLNTASTRIKRGKAILKERFKDLDI